MKFSSETAERKRLENFRWAKSAARKCAREHMVRNYMPGQVVYNLGEYPKAFSMRPTDYDQELLRLLAREGVELIQIHEEWNDSQRVLGADKLSSHDPEGLKEFVGVVHDLGMKIIPYVSTGYFEATDPDFRDEWAGPGRSVALYFHYARCFPDSPGWRAYLLPRIERILDEYGFDGIYDDVGYPSLGPDGPLYALNAAPDAHSHAAFEDLLGTVMEMCQVRGGVFKVHTRVRDFSEGATLWDYIWTGEAAWNLDQLREADKDLEPYVVPCPDLRQSESIEEEELYLHFIPYMQFPLRMDGRPMTGERAAVEGIDYTDGENALSTQLCRRVWEYHQQHPDAPPTYGWWDSCPGRPEARQVWADHLELYRPMAAERTRVWLEVTEGRLFGAPLPEHTVASLFANEETYLVLANFGQTARTVALSDTWKDQQSDARGREWTVPARRLLFLQRAK